MKNENFSILFFIAKKRLLKNGEAPVYLRITVNGVCDETRIKRSVPVNLWNQAKECSRGKDRNSLELNEYIRSLNLKLLTIHKELTLNNVPVTSKLLLSKLFGKEDEGMKLLDIFKEHNEKCRKLIDIDYADITVRRYDNCLKYLGEVIKLKYDKDDLLLKDVNGELIREFEFYMKTEKACKQNTVIRYMKCLKKVTNLALANEWMTKDPFAGIKFKEENTTKEFLEKEELEILIKKEFELERLNLVKDVFLFCCFTGLAFVDVSELKAEHIFKDNSGSMWIRKDRHKIRNRANCTCNIPLLDIPLQILEKYSNHPLCSFKGTLLPVSSNQKMNSYLKEIADFCGIKKHLSTHVARYTFATTVTLANKVSLENVSKMLGHTSTRMTQHYARVLDHSIMDDMNKVKTKVLKQAVKRNIKRFPSDFMIELTKNEWVELVTICDQLPETIKHSYILPYAFTEQGVAMLSTVLRSETAIEINISIMRAFVALRQYALGYAELNRKLESFMIETNMQFNDIYQALTELASKKRKKEYLTKLLAT